MHRIIKLLSAILLFVFVSIQTHGHEFNNSSDIYPIFLPDSILVLSDQQLEFDSDFVLSNIADSGKYYPVDLLSFDFSNSAIWLYFSLDNLNEGELHRKFWIDNADVHSVELYTYCEGKLIQQQVAGKKLPMLERSIEHNIPVFDISLPGNTRCDYVMRIHKLGGALVLPIFLEGYDDFRVHDKQSSSWSLYLTGLQSFAILFNLFLMIAIRRSIYYKYSLYVIFSVLSISGLSGYANFYLWPNFSWLAERETVLFNFLGTIFLLLFVMDYLSLKQTRKNATRFIYGTMAVLSVGFILSLFSHSMVSVAVALSNFTTLWCFVLVVTICIQSLRDNKALALYVLLSYVPIFLAVIAFFLRSVGVVKNTHAAVGLDFAMTFQVLTLAFALVDSFRREQRNNYRAIREKNNELNTLNLAVQETDNSIAYYSKDGELEWCNTGFENLYGLTLNEIKEVHGKHISDINLNADANTYYKASSESKESQTFETEYFDNSGNRKWLQTTLTPISDQLGNICNYITVDSDLTASKLSEEEKNDLQQQLQQSQKMETVGKLAGGIAHDFNNILTPIIGYTDMALGDLPKDTPVREDLKTVLSAAQRAKKLVAQILTFSRHFKEDAHPLNMSVEIAEVIKLLKSSIPTNIKISFSNRATNDFVFADPTQIQQVLMNLCTNASQAIAGNHGQLDIAIVNETISNKERNPKLNRLSSGDYLHLSIKDNGGGMSDEVLAKLFDPFFTTKGVGKGTGLGLSVVHGIVIKYQGEIYFESEEGKGTIAHVYFPLSSKTIKPLSDLADNLKDEQTEGQKERIIIVDDEKNIAQLLGKVLSKNGYKPECFTDSAEALRVYKSRPFTYDLIIADQTMPGLTGAELAQEILSINAEAKVVILTGFSEAMNAEIAESIGVRTLLYKPINMQLLVNKVKELISVN